MEPEIDLRRYARVLWRRRQVIGTIVLLAIAAMGVYSFVVPPMYEGKAILLATQPNIQVGTPPDPRIPGLKIGGVQATELSANALVVFAMSDMIVRQLAAKVQTGDAPDPTLERRLSAQVVRNTNLVELRVRGRNPAWAAAAANVWAAIVTAGSEALFTSSSRQSLTFYDAWLRENEARLREAEENLRKFSATSRIGLLQARVNAVTGQIATFQSRLVDLSVALNRGETELEQIKAQIRQQARIVTLSKSITTDPFLQQAVTATTGRDFAEVSRLRLRNEELNPTYVALDQARANAAVQVATLRAERDRVVQVVGQLNTELSDLRSQLAAQQLEQTQLARAVDNAKQVYDVALQRREEGRVASAGQPGFVRLAARAEVPYYPVAPRKLLNLTVGLLVGSVLGVLVAFGIEYVYAGSSEGLSVRTSPPAAESAHRRKVKA